ncbi:MAG: hypothetical protein COT15_03100 [Candidatus Diapherotrites archaeon CG08_land_8_20_14_0_20_34_12]|nr:MAG: hypothetical protein COT15_03100 [Candidatus Diapherotrites archaeon CG08_land_8_20_14_0_20_34_12]
MYTLLSKLLLTGKLKFEQGKIVAFDEPFALVPMVSLKKITDDAIAKGQQNIQDVYLEGWIYGLAVTKNLIKLFNLKKFEERYKIAMDIIGVIGFGDYQTLSFKRADHAKFRVIGNPFAKLYYPSKGLKICHYIRGMEAGGGTLVHETIMNNIEFECASETGNDCIHANLAKHRLAEIDKSLVESQLDLNYLLPKQAKILETYGYNPKEFNIDVDNLPKL